MILKEITSPNGLTPNFLSKKFNVHAITIARRRKRLEYEKTLHKDLKVERWKELCLYNKRDFETMFTKDESNTLMEYHKDKVILMN
jgi:hypothetical protein